MIIRKHIERLNGYPYFQLIGCTSGEGVLKTYGRKIMKVSVIAKAVGLSDTSYYCSIF
ncbi:MAG: hypothetical protein WCQ54_05525 [Clostridiaceae bacterium]